MSVGLFLTAFGFGLRHGIDWDHIAAIADLSGTAPSRRRGFALSMIYAGGHGAVVFGLGTLALLAGSAIPSSVDAWMGRVVGVTLIALGGWILLELFRKGRNFRLQSRWMLMINGTFAGLRRVRAGITGRRITVEHAHAHEHVDTAHQDVQAHDHAHLRADVAAVQPAPALVGGRSIGRRLRDRPHGHSHGHRHDLELPLSADAAYGSGTAAGIGMLHGIGIESPTQIAIFVASTAVAGTGVGLGLLAAWVVGLMVANAGLALVAGAGMLRADRSFPVYATLAVTIGLASIAMGALYLVGLDILPALS